MDADLTPEAPAESQGQTDAVTELLGAIGYAELTAGLRMAADALAAPGLGVRVWMGRASSAELEHFERIVTRLKEMGQDPETVMEPFIAPVDAFHERTRPRDWLEALVKIYVGDGIARDFYREIAQHVDEGSRELIESVLQVDEQDEFVVGAVTDAIDADPAVAGRLALWARRLVGEAIAQTQYVAVEREALMTMMVGGQQAGVDLADLGRMFTRLIELHGQRMGRLGLTP
ncbi:ferritin-like fold-containing protein [Ornithinimicrobium cryptoxanthini]|uniref:Ferritin-like domain-containing protein n=1 Tax=Ornithinimicrobium cryptoxanthini TaxID=2934161 RepID=A0ABY4YK18_9MICO|nr:ferritin-like fold-containing protein [Ornithinimicrobium cryptoxanthini]USQ77128.1 ferritin-like domain-containing protein [Ornithinimicrobium cryptoxanthini]